jgi:hypothetical protein
VGAAAVSLDDEAERIAKGFGYRGQSSVSPSQFMLNSERPKPAKVPDELLMRQADADIQRMWDEDDGKKTFGDLTPIWFNDVNRAMPALDPALVTVAQYFLADDLYTKAGALLGVDPSRVTAVGYGHNGSLFAFYVSDGPNPANSFVVLNAADPMRWPSKHASKTKPTGKTYVAPGRKAGRTWIDRLQQSKQARKR